MKDCKLLLFDLDGTLLRSDKTISDRTLKDLENARKRGILVGISTSRSEVNCEKFLSSLRPDVFISCGGALVKAGERVLLEAAFTPEETMEFIREARGRFGSGVEMTVDTREKHYWNYKIDPKTLDATWGAAIYTDFEHVDQPCLKFCVETTEEDALWDWVQGMDGVDVIRFSDGNWYKFTKKNATKENAIRETAKALGIDISSITAFGDDYADIGMLKLCGVGVAMGNAIPEVKEAADLTIGSNDRDGIAEYLERILA
ncbi:MAG: HAD family phosphatase [Clostridia bacterium]|nr:HAD family phosphatase [Clostridia bacterium]